MCPTHRLSTVTHMHMHSPVVSASHNCNRTYLHTWSSPDTCQPSHLTVRYSGLLGAALPHPGAPVPRRKGPGPRRTPPHIAQRPASVQPCCRRRRCHHHLRYLPGGQPRSSYGTPDRPSRAQLRSCRRGQWGERSGGRRRRRWGPLGGAAAVGAGDAARCRSRHGGRGGAAARGACLVPATFFLNTRPQWCIPAALLGPCPSLLVVSCYRCCH